MIKETCGLNCMALAASRSITKIATILEPEILGNHNKNTGTTLLLKTIVN